MILSDRTIREELAAGRIVLEPSDDSFDVGYRLVIAGEP